MANMTTKNFEQIVQEWATVAQASLTSPGSPTVLNFDTGSILRAIAEGTSSVALWLQGLILRLLTVTRLRTSKGRDADTFVEDFTLSRLPASAATGEVTYSRTYPIYPAVIPVGAVVETADGSQDFVVTADPTNSAYSATAVNGTSPGYTIPAQVSSLTVPIRFVFPDGTDYSTYTGVVGNVQANSITITKTGISGVDNVSNTNPLTNGFLAEGDDALKARFVAFIASLAKGTEGALGFAINSVQQGLEYQIWEPGIGGFTQLTIYVDDGTGALPVDTLAAAQAAVVAYKAAGVPVSVFAATKINADVTMVITTAAGYYHATVVAQVVAALQLYINGVGLGVTPALGMVSYAKLIQIAFEASPGVIDVTGYSLNGTQNDFVPAAGQTIKAHNIIVS